MNYENVSRQVLMKAFASINTDAELKANRLKNNELADYIDAYCKNNNIDPERLIKSFEEEAAEEKPVVPEGSGEVVDKFKKVKCVVEARDDVCTEEVFTVGKYTYTIMMGHEVELPLFMIDFIKSQKKTIHIPSKDKDKVTEPKEVSRFFVHLV